MTDILFKISSALPFYKMLAYKPGKLLIWNEQVTVINNFLKFWNFRARFLFKKNHLYFLHFLKTCRNYNFLSSRYKWASIGQQWFRKWWRINSCYGAINLKGTRRIKNDGKTYNCRRDSDMKAIKKYIIKGAITHKIRRKSFMPLCGNSGLYGRRTSVK